MISKAERRLIGQIAAHKRWTQVRDRTAATQAARDAQMTGWMQQAREMHPDADDDLIRKVAEHLRQLKMKQMALASAQSRRTRKTAQAPGNNAAPGA